MNKFLNDINEVFVIKIFKKLGRCEAFSSALIQFLVDVRIKSFLCFFLNQWLIILSKNV